MVNNKIFQNHITNESELLSEIYRLIRWEIVTQYGYEEGDDIEESILEDIDEEIKERFEELFGIKYEKE